MSASQRAKGARGEREARDLLRQLWPEADRKPMQARGAKRDGCEVEGTPYWVECKSGARPPILPALRQAQRDIEAHGDERPPLVLAKTDRRGWTVTLRWEDFADLVRSANAAAMLRDHVVAFARESQERARELAPLEPRTQREPTWPPMMVEDKPPYRLMRADASEPVTFSTKREAE